MGNKPWTFRSFGITLGWKMVFIQLESQDCGNHRNALRADRSFHSISDHWQQIQECNVIRRDVGGADNPA